MSRICKNCKKLGEEVYEDWMMYYEHYHKCPTAECFKGLAEEKDEACIWYDPK